MFNEKPRLENCQGNLSKMGNKRCKLCQKVGTKGFFSFPTMKLKEIRAKWLEVCELPAETDTRNLFIFKQHSTYFHFSPLPHALFFHFVISLPLERIMGF